MLNDPPPIEGVLTGTAGFAGINGATLDAPELLTSVADYERHFRKAPAVLGRVVRGFFDNGGMRAYAAGTLAALESIDDIDLLCPLPEDTSEAIAQCERRCDRVAILSLPAGLDRLQDVLAAVPETSAFAALHHPWVRVDGELTPPGGHVAGIYASGGAAGTPTDHDMRGLGDPPLERGFSERKVAALVERAINPLRDLRTVGRGVRVWSDRTLSPDREFRYLPVRRLTIFLKTSICRGLQWVASEPNGEALWASVREVIGTFLMTQWRAGTLKGRAPEEGYFVRCDRTTMTQQDLDRGRLICLVGVAAVRPAEFVIFRIGQWTADRCA
jgi:hypothetical protein